MLRQKSWMTSATTSGALYASSVIAIPICYVVTNIVKLHVDEDNKGFALLCFGIMSIAIICAVTRTLVGKNESPFIYVFTIGAFGSVANLMIALENDEYIRGFINGYLEYGEPYLRSSYGTMLCYWGGIGHYIMYLMMVAAIAWRHPFRDVGLYWIGSMLHSMLVLIIGVLSSSDHLNWPFMMHLPFVAMPIVCGFYFLHYQPSPAEHRRKRAKGSKETLNESLKELAVSIVRLSHRLYDLFLVIMFAASVVISVIRGLAALGSGLSLLKTYRDEIEPYMKDPVGFPRIQLLVYMFCFVPGYVMIIYGLLYPNKKWMPDFALLQAGAAMQAQIVHIGGSLNQRTMFIYRLPQDNIAPFIFWPINIILLVVPQLLAARCIFWPRYFGHDATVEVTATERKPTEGVTKPHASDTMMNTLVTNNTSVSLLSNVKVKAKPQVQVQDDGDVPLVDEKEDTSRPSTPMLKVKFGGPNSASGEEIEMSLTQLKAYHEDLRSLSASATGRNMRRHLSDGGLLPGNIHVRRASGSGRKLTSDDMVQLESLSPSLLAETMKPYVDSAPSSPASSVEESGNDKLGLGSRRRRRGSNASNNQSDALKVDVNMDSLLEEKMPEFDHMTPTSSVSIN